MDLTVDWTELAIGHIARHGILVPQVNEVINSTTTYARKQGDMMIMIGRSSRGVIFIVLKRSLITTDAFEIVTARIATSSEKALFIHRGRGAR